MGRHDRDSCTRCLPLERRRDDHPLKNGESSLELATSGGPIAAYGDVVAQIGRAVGGSGRSTDTGCRTTRDTTGGTFCPGDRCRQHCNAAVSPRADACGARRVGLGAIGPRAVALCVAATRDGRLVYDLAITVTDLPPVGDLGAYSRYEVWLTTPKLDEGHDLGPIENDGTVHAQADWNKFTIIVSAEPNPVPRKWGTAIALIGRSPSSLMQSFASHPLFSTPEPD